MDQARGQEIQVQIASDLVAKAPAGWQRIHATCSALAGFGEFDSLAQTVDGWERFVASHALLVSGDLQEAMFQEGRGSWFGFTVDVEPSGAYHFQFNYDQPVTFDDSPPLDDSWIKELRRHPRPWALIPDWHPVKQRYTEDEWAADLAANGPAGASD